MQVRLLLSLLMAISLEEYRQLLENSSVEEQRARHGDPEHRLQCTMVRWFRITYSNHLIMAIPNGGKRDVRTAKKLKAEGVIAGVPDLLIPEARHGYNNLWIEVKNGSKGRVSDCQEDMHKLLRDHGSMVAIARSFEDFVSIVEDYFN